MSSGYIYSILTAVTWATTGIFIKLIDGFHASNIVFGRSLVALGFVVIIIFAYGKLHSIKKQFRIDTILLSSLMVLYYLCATLSFMNAPVALAALVIAVSPCITLVFKFISGDDILTKEVIGFLICAVGIVVFTISVGMGAEAYNKTKILYGCGFAFLSGFFRASYGYLLWKQKEKSVNYDNDILSLYTFLIAVFILLPFQGNTNTYFALSDNNYIYFLSLGIISTALPNFFNSSASTTLNPAAHSMISMTTPMIAAILAWLIFSESLSILSIISMSITLSGIFVRASAYKLS